MPVHHQAGMRRSSIYEKDFSLGKIRGKHIAPHTIEMAAMWAVLTRLEDAQEAQPDPDAEAEAVQRQDASGVHRGQRQGAEKSRQVREGMDGISPRYIQDKISNALVSRGLNERCVNPFIVVNELESRASSNHSADHRAKRSRSQRFTETCSTRCKREYEDIGQERGSAGDCRRRGRHLTPVRQLRRQRQGLHPEGAGASNPYTGAGRRARRAVDAQRSRRRSTSPKARKDDFRREIMNYIGALALEGKKFDFRTNERLHKALELKLFEDQKDSDQVDQPGEPAWSIKETQEKIDIVKQPLGPTTTVTTCIPAQSDVLQLRGQHLRPRRHQGVSRVPRVRLGRPRGGRRHRSAEHTTP